MWLVQWKKLLNGEDENKYQFICYLNSEVSKYDKYNDRIGKISND